MITNNALGNIPYYRLHPAPFAAALAYRVCDGARTSAANQHEKRNPADHGDQKQENVEQREQTAARALFRHRGHKHIGAAATGTNHKRLLTKVKTI